jgi:hypothetical protein
MGFTLSKVEHDIWMHWKSNTIYEYIGIYINNLAIIVVRNTPQTIIDVLESKHGFEVKQKDTGPISFHLVGMDFFQHDSNGVFFAWSPSMILRRWFCPT